MLVSLVSFKLLVHFCIVCLHRTKFREIFWLKAFISLAHESVLLLFVKYNNNKNTIKILCNTFNALKLNLWCSFNACRWTTFCILNQYISKFWWLCLSVAGRISLYGPPNLKVKGIEISPLYPESNQELY